MSTPEVAILVPHFQTESLARLCLRSIRRYTAGVRYEVVVVDNGSQDGASLEYLRGVEWIKLIERTTGIDSWPPKAHKEALDVAAAATDAPYLLSFHTDTIPIREDWLRWHLDQIQADPKIAAVGTYKLELKSPLQRVSKWLESTFYRRKLDRNGKPVKPENYIRSHCALYRRDVLDKLGLAFEDGTRYAAGLVIHFDLERHGYQAKLLSVDEALERVVHLNHGTMVLVPELGGSRKNIKQGTRRIQRFLSDPRVQEVFHDERLDKGRLEWQSGQPGLGRVA